MIRCGWSVVFYASAVHVLLKQFYQSLQQEISLAITDTSVTTDSEEVE